MHSRAASAFTSRIAVALVQWWLAAEALAREGLCNVCRAMLGSTLVGSVDDLPDVAGDLVKLVAGKVDLNFSR